jgi:hypothetical protein
MDFRCFCLSISRLVFGNKIIIERIITQSELWLAKWQEAVDFLETNHRKPSKFVPEERNMRSWWKHNKKLMNAGELRPERVEMFKQLLELGEKYKHVNQYQ